MSNNVHRGHVQCAVQFTGTENRLPISMPRTSAMACPTLVNSPPLSTVEAVAVASHHPAHAARQRCGIAAVKVPSTAMAP